MSNNKKKILFVDDEIDQLKSMRVLLHSKRHEWSAKFVPTGAEAIERLSSENFDMVVTDLRMPDMSGEVVLEKVHEMQPGAIRFVLSGYSDSNEIIKSAKKAHQFLSKPCTPEQLIGAIQRSLELKKVILNENVSRAIAAINELPTLPKLYLELEEELNSEDSSVTRIGQLISSDVSMTASILKMVNSSFFGIYSKVSSPVKAVTLLGLNTIKGLVLGVHLFGSVDDNHPDFSIQSLSEHCMYTGLLAKEIINIEKGGREMEEQAFLAGFLHDLGKLVLFSSFPEKYSEVLRTLNSEHVSTYQAEADILGFSHAEVGAYLLALWGFDADVVNAVFSHHDPSKQDKCEVSPALAVHIANSFEHELNVKNEHYDPHLLDAVWLEQNGFSAKLPMYLENCALKVEENESN